MTPHVEAQLSAGKHESTEISRRRFAMAGLCAGATLLTPGALAAVEAKTQIPGRIGGRALRFRR